MVRVIAKAPVNIAVIKYWGKRDENLILPINDSLSCTLNTDQLCAETNIVCDETLKENKFHLNGEEQSFDNQRLQNCLKHIKMRAEQENGKSEILNWKLHITSENNFPTAAGLASSAAGYACLVKALATLYSVKTDITSIARVGSGSACRSIYGGWVQWFKGTKNDGSDSIAKQILDEDYWPEMRILILVVNDKKKKISSSIGMKNSVQTSDLIHFRAEHCVPKRVDNIIQALKTKDFNMFAKITMQDSNQFHAVALDTYPPRVYMNDVSHSIVDLVHFYNKIYSENKVAYSFDAGPNACLFLEKQTLKEFIEVLKFCYPSEENQFIKGLPLEDNIELSKEFQKKLMEFKQNEHNLVKYIIHTKSGKGAQANII